MTASKKKTVRTRRGVEPAGRPARREVERGRGARTNSSRTFAQVQPVQSSRASFLWLFSSVAMVLCAALAP